MTRMLKYSWCCALYCWGRSISNLVFSSSYLACPCGAFSVS